MDNSIFIIEFTGRKTKHRGLFIPNKYFIGPNMYQMMKRIKMDFHSLFTVDKEDIDIHNHLYWVQSEGEIMNSMSISNIQNTCPSDFCWIYLKKGAKLKRIDITFDDKNIGDGLIFVDREASMFAQNKIWQHPRKYDKYIVNPDDEIIKNIYYNIVYPVKKDKFGAIVRTGEICADEFGTQYYLEDGVFDESIKESYNGKLPGIYMNFFKYRSKTLSSKIESHFDPVKISVDDRVDDLAFMFDAKCIFSNFKVNLMADEYSVTNIPFIHISLRQFIDNPDKDTNCVIRTNSINLSDRISIIVMFTPTEIEFIRDKVGRNITFSNVIDMYKRLMSDKKTPWFIRKSCLKKVLDTYGYAPPMIPICYSDNAIKTLDIKSMYRNKEQDVTSDGEFINFDN